MALSWSSILAFRIPDTGTDQGTWGTTTNNHLKMIEKAMMRYSTFSITSSTTGLSWDSGTSTATWTLPTPSAAHDDANPAGYTRSAYLELTGSHTGTITLVIAGAAAATVVDRKYYIKNSTNQSIVFKNSSAGSASSFTLEATRVCEIICRSGTTDVIFPLNNLLIQDAKILGTTNVVTLTGTGTATLPTIVNSTAITMSGTYKIDCDSYLGNNNNAIGLDAGNLVAGIDNTLIGSSTGKLIVNGSSNVMVGNNIAGTALSSTTASNNVVLGNNAAANAGVLSDSVIIGNDACRHNLLATASASSCVAIGSNAAKNQTLGSGSVVIGSGVCGLATSSIGARSILIGESVSYAGITGVNNIVIGTSNVTYSVITGDSNVIIGRQAGDAVTSGQYNVIMGRNTGTALTTGSSNVIIGDEAGLAALGAGTNVLIGYQAGDAVTSGNSNVYVGPGAGGGSTTGSNNIGIGLSNLTAAVTGDDNIVIGNGSATGITSGANNIVLGEGAATSITTGINNIIIGKGANASNGSNQFIIDNALRAQKYLVADLDEGKTLFNSYDADEYGLKIWNRDAAYASASLTGIFEVECANNSVVENTYNFIACKHSGDIKFRVSNSGGVYSDSGIYTTGADYADYFEPDESFPYPEIGDTIFVTDDGKIAPANKSNTQLVSSVVAGVISEKPAFVGNSNLLKGVPVGLVGRLKVNKKSPVHPDWIKLRELDSEFDEWLVR